MTKLVQTYIKGREKLWHVGWYEDENEVERMRDDGIEIDYVENTIPLWVAKQGNGFLKAWCFLQDVWNFNWSKK